ncbi:MAG: helix-turn-helix domain-containing protein [Acidobacteria bacterium]|nr:helix-turn-helix domain-containing protein [Acidobacteriota bacterium]
MDDLGFRLRSAREAQGVSLREIAARTKISVGTLEALERNDYSRLPGGIFGRAFVRAYALEIGADPDETVTAFQARLEESEREAAERGAIRAEISQDDRDFLARQRLAIRALRAVLALVVLVVIVAVVWWARRP